MGTDLPYVWVGSVAKKLPDSVLGLLRENFNVVYHQEAVDNPDLGARIQGGFFIPSHDDQASAEDWTQFPIRVLANYGVGVDHFDIPALNERGFRITNTPGVLSSTTADMAFGLMLASARQIVKGASLSMAPVPAQSPGDLGQDVSGQTVGIVGMGSIGFQVARRARGFDMEVLYHNRQRRIEEEAAVSATFCPDLNDMLGKCDYVVISCPCTPSTVNLIGADALAHMKKTATLVNVARGKVVDTDALVAALRAGTIRGAALDVTEPEPLPAGHPLTTLPNVVITPHWASATIQCRLRMMQLCIDNIKAGIEGRPLLTEVVPSS